MCIFLNVCISQLPIHRPSHDVYSTFFFFDLDPASLSSGNLSVLFPVNPAVVGPEGLYRVGHVGSLPPPPQSVTPPLEDDEVGTLKVRVQRCHIHIEVRVKRCRNHILRDEGAVLPHIILYSHIYLSAFCQWFH